MKKAFMLVAAIALLAAPVFAEVEVTISGDATTSVGFNLDDSTYGMLSEVSSDVEIMVGALDGESMGEGNWYGVITLEGAGLAFSSSPVDGDYRILADGTNLESYDADDDEWTAIDAGEYVYPYYQLTTPEVSAKITNGNVYVMLQDTADFDADYVAGVDNDPFEFAAPDTAGSITVGGTFAPVTMAVEFGTAGSYADTSQVDGVALGANLGLDLAPIMVDVAFAAGFGYAVDQEIGIAAQVVADVAPLMITAAFDSQILSGTLTWETGANISVDLDPITVAVDVRFAVDDLDTKLTLGYATDMFTADAYFGLYDLTTTIMWETGVDVTVMINSGITANAGWSFDSADIMTAYADVAFTELVDNVTFTLGWENADDMLDADAAETNFGDIYLSAGIEY